MKCVSIGYFRDDGDFALLATLNNNDGDIQVFEFIVEDLRRNISLSTGIECIKGRCTRLCNHLIEMGR
jgi:hypothetical protein